MMARQHEDSYPPSRPAGKAATRVRRGRIVAMASLLAAAPMVTGLPQISFQAQPEPVSSVVHKVAFITSWATSMRAEGGTSAAPGTAGAVDPTTTARAGATTAVQNVAGAVTVVGVTWPKGTVSTADTFQIRTMTGATWSQWQLLDRPDGGPDGAEAAAATPGTDPFVITGASQYEVRSLTTNATAPTTATVQAVDPGVSSADASPQQAGPPPGAASAATAKPAILTRAAWGANERLRRLAPTYGTIVMGFVHHTDSPNNYTEAEVPAMIRGMYAYHVQGLGWDDIGYNFLVDRFGRTWEGRYGGMDRAVVGAQTQDYNGVSMGVSAIGNFDVAAVPQVMTNAYERIFAWKFSLSHIPAIGIVPAPRPPSWSGATYFQRISGHRDGFQTTCPGRYMYAKLPEIRSGTATLLGGPQVAAPAPTSKPVAKPVARPAAKSPWAVTRYTPYKAVALRQGSKGIAVRFLQQGLKLKTDGAFGPATRKALVAFQKKQKIAQDGVVGPAVWAQLEKRDYPLIAYRSVTLRLGSKGTAVVILQRALRLKADGAFGAKTTAAVKAVQQAAKLAASGVVSGYTWVAIENRMPR